VEDSRADADILFDLRYYEEAVAREFQMQQSSVIVLT
jgi:hypothetical protein